jgi:hypothetical protein
MNKTDMKTQRKQVVGYVEEHIKKELADFKKANRRLTESRLIEEALLIALPTLQKKYSGVKT